MVTSWQHHSLCHRGIADYGNLYRYLIYTRYLFLRYPLCCKCQTDHEIAKNRLRFAGIAHMLRSLWRSPIIANCFEYQKVQTMVTCMDTALNKAFCSSVPGVLRMPNWSQKSEIFIPIRWNRTYFQKSLKRSSQRISHCTRNDATYGDLRCYSSLLDIFLFDSWWIANAKPIAKIRKIDSKLLESHITLEILDIVLTTPLTLPPRKCGLWWPV